MILPGVWISIRSQETLPVELYGNLRAWSDDKDAVMQRVSRATPAGTVPWAGTAALSELAG